MRDLVDIYVRLSDAFGGAYFTRYLYINQICLIKI